MNAVAVTTKKAGILISVPANTKCSEISKLGKLPELADPLERSAQIQLGAPPRIFNDQDCKVVVGKWNGATRVAVGHVSMSGWEILVGATGSPESAELALASSRGSYVHINWYTGKVEIHGGSRTLGDLAEKPEMEALAKDLIGARVLALRREIGCNSP